MFYVLCFMFHEDMFTLSTKIRKDFGKKTKSLRDKDRIPSVIYGPGIKNLSLDVDYKEFEGVFRETGESSLISLEIEGEKKKRPVLVYDVQKDPVTDRFIHIDFYQASLKKEIEVAVSLIFEGVSLAVKELGGTLVKDITEVKVKALPQNLPHEIKVNVEGLKTFEDHILIKDLTVSKEVKILRKPEEIVASVFPPEKIEEELEKPIEEKVEEVERVEGKKKREEEVSISAEKQENEKKGGTKEKSK